MSGSTKHIKVAMRSATALLVALFVASIGLASSAGAQPYTDGAITFDPGSPGVGGSTTMTAEGFNPGCAATIDVEGGDPISATADANGDVIATIPVPADAVAGSTVTVTVTCGDDAETGSFTVAGEPGTTTSVAGETTVPGTAGPTEPGVGTDTTPGAAKPGAATPPAEDETLPQTGSNTAALLAVGLGLAAMGAVIVVLARRRRASTNA